jgi:hypothetical protein
MNSTIFAEKPVVAVTPKVGDILCGSWGYEATLYVSVKVLSVTGKMIKVQEMTTEHIPSDHCSGGMEWKERLTGGTCGEVMVKKVTAYKDGYRIKWTSYLNLYGPYKGDGIFECSNYH